MLRKTIAAAAAFAATLFFSLGCPRPDANQDAKPQPNASSGSLEQSTRQPAAPAHVASESSPPATLIKPNPGPSAGAAANDPPFKNWPRPKAVIVCSGMQMGYIEPCGCSGLENQKGGLSRRANFLNKLAADGWAVETVDVGGQIERFGKQAELKFLATSDALKTMHYTAIGFGPDDLKLPAESLTLAVTDLKQADSPFVSANVALFDFSQGLTPRFRVSTVGGIKIGVTSILGDAEQKAINNPDVAFKPAQAALAEVVPQMKKAGAERMLLLAQASKDETLQLVKQFPEFDFVVVSYGAPVPPPQPDTAPDAKTRLIEVSQKAEYVNVVGLFDDAEHPVRFERVALDAHWGESRDMKRVMADYQEQLKTLGLAGLNVTPEKQPSGWTYAGSQACADCHTKAFAVWEKTPHAKALDTLAKLNPPRNFDPQCLSCHVTGWDPQRFRPFEGGYESMQKTPQLAHNGCENCHGPGSEHVAIESGTKTVDDKERDRLRAAMHVSMADAEQGCIRCHDGDNSLNFNFKTYWPKVAHKGKD
ncbi:MAG TPA: multiheme c-type cytochrome [Pirellulales bacterium]|jgi:hypothetical protein|nr:multiheme c-type cytochrome [Pirellulales bacterium]